MATYREGKSRFKTGMFLLENITSGMYNDSLAILREYIQNSVDSIDLAHSDSKTSSAEIQIALDPFKKQLVIRDNGQGIPSDVAEEVLCSIGSSNKTDNRLRGFRGIGRLGGIAFSDRAVFRTKAEGEVVESIQEWDCVNLRKIIGERQKKNYTLTQILSRITSFTKENQKESQGSYFEVTLDGVNSFRNYLFDITRVERFLSQVAPVPFDSNNFRYAGNIDAKLSDKLSYHRRYKITLNGMPIYKPYLNHVRVTKGGIDQINAIEYFDILGQNDELVATGWYGKREDLLGGIARGDDSSGIRVRAGNIMIGDNHLLDGCFRETRFNNYFPGEIHIESANLVPNSRRDDFVDNNYKNIFYNGVERELGLPLSKEIRLRSRITGKAKNIKTRESNVSTSLEKDLALSEAKQDYKYQPLELNVKSIPQRDKDRLLTEIINERHNCPRIERIIASVLQRNTN